MCSEGYGTWFVSVSVCLSVTTFSVTTLNETTKQRYQRVHRYTGFILKKVIFVELLRSKVMVGKAEQANMQITQAYLNWVRLFCVS